MPLEVAERISSRQVPKSNRFVETRGDRNAVRFREVERGDGSEMAGECLHEHAVSPCDFVRIAPTHHEGDSAGKVIVLAGEEGRALASAR